MRLPLATLLALAASGAHALEDFSNPVVLNTLSATVANSSYTLDAATPVSTQGNVVSGVSTSGFGVIGIVQNTGAQANVQQIINVSIGTLNFSQSN